MTAAVGSSPGRDSTFTDAHWDALFAILDTVIPPIVVDRGSAAAKDGRFLTVSEDEFERLYQDVQSTLKHPPTRDAFSSYLASRASDNAAFVTATKSTIERLPSVAKLKLRFLIGVMDTRLGGLITTGYFAPITVQSAETRANILQAWHKSWLYVWPVLARTFTVMAKAAWSQAEPKIPEITGFQTPRESGRIAPGPTHDFDFIQFDSSSTEPAIVDTDVVIVGSGCGGGVCAKTLAEAGHRVLVVERGYYYPPEELPVQTHNLERLMKDAGGIATVDGSVLVAAGGAWGGGGNINWGISLHTPEPVLKEWAGDGSGSEGDAGSLAFFTGPEFQESLDRVCAAMGVSTDHAQHNYTNEVLRQGADRLGWESALLPQNSGGRPHGCGASCAQGCREGRKQGPAVNWLPAAGQAGARFIEGLAVSNVVFEQGDDGNRRAVGIEGVWASREAAYEEEPKVQRPVRVNAKRVIVTAGGINTPLLLQRSGLENPHIGKNLHLHPAGCFTATFDDEVRGWEGDISTVVVGEFADIDGQYHGARIIGTSMSLFVTLLQIPWQNGPQYKTDALKLPNLASYVSIVRDRDSGSVSADPANPNVPILHYTLSPFDRQNVVAGLVATAKICYVQGARELAPLVPGVPALRCTAAIDGRSVKDPEFAEWVARLGAVDMIPTSSTFNSGHQMGSCRMSASATDGVVDGNGKVWGVDGLYVADTSVFPSASGVNPMVTVMALADRIARGIAAGL